MNRRMLLLALVCAFPLGCGGGDEPTEFESSLTTFVKQAKLLRNQIEMGMPAKDQVEQTDKLRTLLATLNPVGEREDERFAQAKDLYNRLQTWSECRIDPTAWSDAGWEKSVKYKIMTEKEVAELRAYRDSCPPESARLISELSGEKGPSVAQRVSTN